MLGKSFVLLLCLITALSAKEGWIIAPNHEKQPPVNQRKAGPNACGPACLLDAFYSADQRWHKSLRPYRSLKTDKERIQLVIRRHGLKPSRQFRGQIRWNRNKGVNIADLGAMANEMRRGFSLEKLKFKVLFREEKETHQSLLKRVHQQFSESLEAGFPPIISIRRVANRRLPRSGTRMWMTVQGHFVVITGIPKKLNKDDTFFFVTYHDPWTGRALMGKVRIPKEKFWATPPYQGKGKFYESPTLIADFPSSRIGIKKVKKGEKHALTLAGAVGAF